MKIFKSENPEILSVAVMKNGKMIAETQQTGKLYPQYSIMKSLVALVIGRLCDEGKLTPEVTVGQILHTGNAPISDISLHELLSMQSGMKHKLLFQDRNTCIDYLKACCEIPVKKLQDGQKQEFLYTNACAYLAGRMAEAVADVSLKEQIIRDLFLPLGITDYELEYDPQGHVFGASGLKLGTEDLAKIGQGIMDGRICSSQWLELCTSLHAVSETGMPYGYFFWLLADGFYMSGKWGQRCFVLPEYHAVIAVNSDMQHKDIANHDIFCEIFTFLEG